MKRYFPAFALLVLAIPALAQTKINAAGATFPYPIYSKWFNQYHQMHPDIEINYQSIGSGGGIAQLKSGTVDFGASDMPLDDTKVKQMPMPILQPGNHCRHLPWRDHQVERQSDCRRQPRRQPA